MRPDAPRERIDGVTAIGAALFAAVLLRVAFQLYFPLTDCVNTSYVNPAKDILAGQFAAPGSLLRLPGAIYFFAFCLALFHGDYGSVVAVQHLLGIVSLCVAIDFAREAWGRRAGICAAALLSLQFLFALQESYLQSEAVCQLLLLATLRVALHLRRNNPFRLWPWALGGAAAALTALTRGEYVLLGPLTAAALALPGAGRAGARLPRAGLFLAAWAFLVGGWVLRNRLLFGYTGLVPDGPAVLMDTVLPLVRYDLPTQPLVKRVLKEETVKWEAQKDSGPHLHPRVSAGFRLESEFGYSHVQQKQALAEVAREAALTQPRRYLRLVWGNAREYLTPQLWLLSTSLSPNWTRFSPEGGAPLALWRLLWLDQGWGWAATAAAALALVLLPFAPAPQRWAAALVAAVYLYNLLMLSLMTFNTRMQSILCVPLGLAGAFAAGRAWDRASAPRRAQ
jgi:hypothetical protein